MICAPRASRDSCVSPLTVPSVPTGMNAGVSMAPGGVSRRPRRAPVGSVARTSKRNGIHRVYQENIAATPTLTRTKTTQIPTIHVSALPNLIFFGRTAEYAKAIRPKTQKVKMSSEVQSDRSHLGASLERNVPALDATRF